VIETRQRNNKIAKELTNSRPIPLEAPCTIETPPSNFFAEVEKKTLFAIVLIM
jgi:hypothetical protein